ncbi:proton-coupled folate transporter-like isoform X1 [Asterias amurensis]|uniref:proton-coupled folate transporter-like isoform X1 n=2 Tax=Asterias amurensis TaxID=7602 RepID=UPI003AB36A07
MSHVSSYHSIMDSVEFSMASTESPETYKMHRNHGRASSRWITVEPILILINFVQGALVTLRSQYIEHRLAKEKNYTIPSGMNSCAHLEDPTDKWIEGQTALWVTLMKDTSVFPPIVVALVLGAASDFVGRRPMFIVNATGHFLASGLFLCIAIFELDLWLLIVGEVILGVAGDAVFAAIIAEAYVADIYTGNSRAFRLVVVDGLIQFSFGVIQFAIGETLQNTGNNFVIVYAITVAVAFVNLLYTIIPGLVLETVKRRPFPNNVPKDILKNIVSLFDKAHAGRRWRLVLLLINACLWTVIFEAAPGNVIIYGLSPPFCWMPDTVGAYGAISNALPAVVAILAMPLFGLCISVYWMVYIGFLSGIGYLLTTAFAPTTLWLAYIAPVIGMFLLLPLPIIKSKLSEQVDDSEQGAVFGCLAVVISLARFVSPLLLNGVLRYEIDKTHNSHPVVTYFMASAILLLPMGINMILHIFQPKKRYVCLDDVNAVLSPDNGNKVDACADETDARQSLLPKQHDS